MVPAEWRWTFGPKGFCLCLSEETLKAGGPFYLVSMPGEVKDATQGVNVTCSNKMSHMSKQKLS